MTAAKGRDRVARPLKFFRDHLARGIHLGSVDVLDVGRAAPVAISRSVAVPPSSLVKITE